MIYVFLYEEFLLRIQTIVNKILEREKNLTINLRLSVSLMNKTSFKNSELKYSIDSQRQMGPLKVI